MSAKVCCGRLLVFFAFLALFSSAVQAQSADTVAITVFGAKQFTRTTGVPNVAPEVFSVPLSVHDPFVLKVVDGAESGRHRASSAEVRVNRARIIGPADIGQHIAAIERPVVLNATNTLEVELRGQPGDFVIVSVIGHIDADTPLHTSSAVMNESGGTMELPGTAALTVPSGAVPAGNVHIELSTIDSPYMDLLAAEFGASLRLLNVPKLRIKASQAFTQGVRLRVTGFELQNLPPNTEPVVLSLVQQHGADDEQSDTLVSLGGVRCAIDAVCV